MPRTYYDSTIFFPSQNKIPSPKFSTDHSVPLSTAEMTTRRPGIADMTKPEKLQSMPSDVKMNIRIFHAVQLSNNKFDIRQIYPVKANQNQELASNTFNNNGFATVSSTIYAGDPKSIPALQLSEWSLGGARLILEPSSKAITGNGGTAISSPISRAILRKNMGTHVHYRPESVAVAGVGGTAHAQSDLILDYVE